MLVSPLVIVHSKISFTSMDSNQNSFRHNNFIALRRSYIRILMCSLNICVLTRIRCLIDTIVCIVYAAICIRVCKYWLLVRTKKNYELMLICELCFSVVLILILRCCAAAFGAILISVQLHYAYGSTRWSVEYECMYTNIHIVVVHSIQAIRKRWLNLYVLYL